MKPSLHRGGMKHPLRECGLQQKLYKLLMPDALALQILNIASAITSHIWVILAVNLVEEKGRTQPMER